MKTDVVQTNTTRAAAVLSYADIVRVLGLAVAVDAGLRLDAPGTTITAELAPADAAGEFTASVAVLVDHNFVPPQPQPEPQPGQGDGAGPGDPSLNSGAVEAALPPAPMLAGLQIPGAPGAATA